MNLIQYWKEKNKQDFDVFVKTNTSVSQIQALTELKKDAVELTTDEYGRKGMKDKENQVFGGYGNHDFPTEIKQERPNNTTSQSEKIVYGSLITSTKCYNCIHFPLCFAQKGGANLELASENGCCYYQSKLPEDSVVLSREEYEMLKSLYDTQKGAIMTSSIGDLPLTVEGLRKAVDEITRLNRVETELQELNAKYYNEAKDLRRELKQTRKDTAKAILNVLYFNLQNSVMGRIQEIAKNYGVEVEE